MQIFGGLTTDFVNLSNGCIKVLDVHVYELVLMVSAVDDSAADVIRRRLSGTYK